MRYEHARAKDNESYQFGSGKWEVLSVPLATDHSPLLH